MANGISRGEPHGFNKVRIRNFVKVPEFDKHLKKAEGHIGQNVVEVTIKLKKTLNDKNILTIFSFTLNIIFIILIYIDKKKILRNMKFIL